MKPLQDNVLIELEPLETRTASGVILADFEYEDGENKKGRTKKRNAPTRFAKVLAVGNGHFPGCKHCGNVKNTFIPTTVKPGDRVLVPGLAGEDYSMDISAPRHHKAHHNFAEIGEVRGELRIVREGQILGLVEE